jgi:hypothetical protein
MKTKTRFTIDALPPVLERAARALTFIHGVPLEMSALVVAAAASLAGAKGARMAETQTDPGQDPREKE